MKKTICFTLLAGLFLFANSCHDDEIRNNTDLALKSASMKEKETVADVKSWFENNPEQNSFELLKWSDEIKWSSAQVMEIDNSVVVEVQVKLKGNNKVMAEKDPSINVDHRLLFIKENGNITSYMEYFVSKNDLGYLQDTEKVNYSKKGKNFDGTIVLESSKKVIKVVSSIKTGDECGELKLKNASRICLCLVEFNSDGSIYRTIAVLWCSDGGSGYVGDVGYGGSGDSPPPPTTQSCNCNICPVCGKCLGMLKSAPVDNEGGTTTTVACEMCAGHPVPEPVVNATDLQNNAKANCIYQKLTNGSILSSFISRYFGITAPNQSYLGELNLTWTLGGTSYAGETLPIGVSNNNSYYSVEIRINSESLDSKASTLVAMTMLHEALHAKLIAEYYDSVGSTDFKRLYAYYEGWEPWNIDANQETEMLNLYSNDMANALLSFDQGRGINHPLSLYKEAVKYSLATDIFYQGYYQSGEDEFFILFNCTKDCN